MSFALTAGGSYRLLVVERDSMKLLTVEEVAEELRVSARSIREAIRKGELPYVALGPKGTARRIRVADLEAFLEMRLVDQDRAPLPRTTKMGNGPGVIRQLTETGRR